MRQILIIFLLFTLHVYPQSSGGEKIVVCDYSSKKNLKEAIVVYAGRKYNSSEDGTYYVKNVNWQKGVRASYIGFKDTTVFSKTDTIFLVEQANDLREVVIEKEKKKVNLIAKSANIFHDYEINFGFYSKAALYVKNNDNSKDVEIKKIKLQLKDVLGVKNTKYLPFKISLYSYDTLSGLPMLPIFPPLVNKKKSNKKWTEVDVSAFHISMPPEGLFIVVEFLPKEEYKIEFIQSEAGIINPLPTIGAYYTGGNPKDSFLYEGCYDCGEEKYWTALPCHFRMELIF